MVNVMEIYYLGDKSFSVKNFEGVIEILTLDMLKERWLYSYEINQKEKIQMKADRVPPGMKSIRKSV